MSYNVDSSDYLSGQLTIGRKVARLFLAEHEDDMAEGNFFTELDLDESLPDDEQLSIEMPWWYGEFSGNSIETFEDALRLTQGKAPLASGLCGKAGTIRQVTTSLMGR